MGSAKGEHTSPDTEFKKGHAPSYTGWKGKTFSIKHRQKLSKSHRGQTPWIKGKTKKEYPQITGGCTFQKGFTPWNKNKKGCYSKDILKKILHRRIPTSLEGKFQKIVGKYNLPYKFVGNGSFTIGHFNPDFINTNSEKIAVEVFARFHKQRNHINIENWKKERTRVFKKYGWEILYFDETEVNEKCILNKLGVEEIVC